MVPKAWHEMAESEGAKPCETDNRGKKAVFVITAKIGVITMWVERFRDSVYTWKS
jgi:hypothetical protein